MFEYAKYARFGEDARKLCATGVWYVHVCVISFCGCAQSVKTLRRRNRCDFSDVQVSSSESSSFQELRTRRCCAGYFRCGAGDECATTCIGSLASCVRCV